MFKPGDLIIGVDFDTLNSRWGIPGACKDVGNQGLIGKVLTVKSISGAGCIHTEEGPGGLSPIRFDLYPSELVGLFKEIFSQ